MQKRKSETVEEFKERRRIYNAANRDPARNRADAKAWAAANPEKNKARNAKWRSENRDLMSQIRADWKERNKPLLRVYKQTRRARVAASGGVLSADIAERLFTSQRGKCTNCNGKLAEYHLDHIMPLALGGVNEDSNMQLLCPSCNWRKNAMHPVDFAQKEGRLL